MVTRSGEPAPGSSASGPSAGSLDVEARRPVRLGLLDTHEDLLAAMSTWIRSHAPDFELVIGAATWPDLVTSDVFPTQVVIMDVEVREPISIEARIRTCRAAGAAVVVLSESEDDEIHERTLRAGALRHLAKSRPMRDVMEQTRAALEMRSADVSAAQWRPLPSGVATQQRPRLSAGELEALRLYASGSTTPEVAAKMNVQFETAKTYLQRVRRKYSAAGRPAGRRADLIRRAGEDGLLP
ncbi:helix-turn-helix transcriptional regulator [Rathayibacter tanaceti]|uniref:DNA-binding response regulator n=2 Tax=Rathayibacter tanaceti TaxID=1671680 RepID=A0A166I0C1_9MICO|nr:LuxR C-terminal-related transcriptional regulator [Rathayibacter tanaceti]KZX21434.1 Transcriptional regulatory protein LiaR [Rathayibacter tanaceti]QHC54903.1 DNA-binding response regulator [Rathayibacter tanaceti]TCO38440.1 DNA-binding NarL/FixJ family response regulator [Rathayibacter tanaceti]